MSYASTTLTPPNKLEVTKKKNEVVKALGSTFRERFRLTIPTDGVFTWRRSSQYNHGVVLQLTPRIIQSRDYILAELSLDTPFKVTYMLVKVTRIPSGRGAYIDEETSRRELTVAEIVQYQDDGGQLQRPIDDAVRDPINAERNLFVLVQWYYMCRGLADVTNGDSKAFALQLKATTKAISILGTPNRTDRRSRARTIARSSALSFEEAGKQSSSRSSHDIRRPGAAASSALDASFNHQRSSDGDIDELSSVVQDLSGSPSEATRDLVVQKGVEHPIEQGAIDEESIKHRSRTVLQCAADRLRSNSLELAQIVAAKAQDISAVDLDSQAIPATTRTSVPIPEPLKVLHGFPDKSVPQIMPTPTPTPTPTVIATSPWNSRSAKTTDYSCNEDVPHLIPTIRATSLRDSRPSKYGGIDISSAYKLATDMTASSTSIVIDHRLAQSILEQTVKEEGLLRYSKDVVKSITMAKYAHKDYVPLVIRMEDKGLQKGVFACLTTNQRNPEVDICFQDREGEEFKRVEISIPKRVQKALRRPFSQAICWDVLPGGHQDGGDRVRLFCKYVFAAKGYLSWGAFTDRNIEEVTSMLAFMRDKEPDFIRRSGVLFGAADEDVNNLVPPSSKGAIQRRKRKRQDEERLPPAFEPLTNSLISPSQGKFYDSVTGSARSSAAFRPSDSPAVISQEHHPAHTARRTESHSANQ
ncbi:hypothetical protein SVAN01_04002 [Stagonosporopsis vannaccii]|nr:hypothetical protein SVAN01_04002 [Stagonosporopsis vannaccii]